jgi:hypothetical protein
MSENTIKPDQTPSRLQSLGWKKDVDMYKSSTAMQHVVIDMLTGTSVRGDNSKGLHPFDVHAPVLFLGSLSVGVEVVPNLSEYVFVDDLDALVADIVIFALDDPTNGRYMLRGWIETERFKDEAEVRDAAYFPVSKLKDFDELPHSSTGRPIVYIKSGEHRGQYANLSEYQEYQLGNLRVAAYSCETHTGHEDRWCRDWYLQGPDRYFVHVLRADGHIYLTPYDVNAAKFLHNQATRTAYTLLDLKPAANDRVPISTEPIRTVSGEGLKEGFEAYKQSPHPSYLSVNGFKLQTISTSNPSHGICLASTDDFEGDVALLAQVVGPLKVQMIGWIWRKDFLKHAKMRDLGFGPRLCCPPDRLKPVDELWALLNVRWGSQKHSLFPRSGRQKV